MQKRAFRAVTGRLLRLHTEPRKPFDGIAANSLADVGGGGHARLMRLMDTAKRQKKTSPPKPI